VVAAIKIDKRQIQELAKAIEGSRTKVKKELNIAINETQKKVKSSVAKVVTQELSIAQKYVRSALRSKRSTAKTLAASVDLTKTGRLSLHLFTPKPKQNIKGVTYKVSKTKGRKLLPNAFQGPKSTKQAQPGKKPRKTKAYAFTVKPSWGGKVFTREGNAKTPIHRADGPSPWGVYVKSKKDRRLRKEAKAELKKQIQRRIRFQKLKQSGAI